MWIGSEICVSVVRLTDGSVRLGFEAPKDLRILRSELTLPKDKDVTHDPDRD